MIPLDRLGLFLMRNSVAPSSQRTYALGWQAWCNFASAIDSDPWLRPSSSCAYPVEPFATPEVAVTVAFIAYCHFSKALSPSTVSTYLAGVRFELAMSGRDTSFLHDPAVDMAKSGSHLLYRRQDTIGKTSTLPCSLDMILAYQRSVPASYERYHGIITGMLLAFTMLLRVSEYIQLSTSDHHFRSQDVVFVLRSGVSHNSSNVSNDMWSAVQKVIFLVRSAKNDALGHGSKLIFARNPSSASSGLCICKVAFDWAIRARLGVGDPFLSYRQQWRVTYEDINRGIKAAAILAGLDPRRFSTHSLRYGGASALAAAGVSHYAIQLYGRWQSTAFLQYLKLSERVFNRTMSTLLDTAIFTLPDVQAMFPV